jgi:hypothetical protein
LLTSIILASDLEDHGSKQAGSNSSGDPYLEKLIEKKKKGRVEWLKV